MEETAIKTKNIHPKSIPYCFNSCDEATAAVLAVKEKYDSKVHVFSIGRTIFVNEHKSTLMDHDIRSFVISLGGRDSLDKGKFTFS